MKRGAVCACGHEKTPWHDTGPCTYGHDHRMGGCTCPGHHRRGGVPRMPSAAGGTSDPIVALLRTADDMAHAHLAFAHALRRVYEVERASGSHGIVGSLTLRGRELNGSSAAPRARVPKRDETPPSTVALMKGERRILVAVLQHGQVDRTQLSVLTGYKRSSRDTYVAKLFARGLLREDDRGIAPTAAGVEAVPSFQELPKGHALQRWWLERLGAGEATVLNAVLGAYPSPADRETISAITGYARSSRDTYIQRLAARKLVEPNGQGVRAAAMLFDESP